jgi:hypothetical protein
MASDEVRYVEFESADLPPVLRYQVLSFLRIVWPEGFTGALRYRDWITNPAYKPHHLLYVAGDLVVSHLEIVHRTVTHEGVTYQAYAPTSVLTFPAFRREGWAGKLVEKASRRIEGPAQTLRSSGAGTIARSSVKRVRSVANSLLKRRESHRQTTFGRATGRLDMDTLQEPRSFSIACCR